MKTLAAAATLVFALIVAGASHATTVLYTFAGTGTGSLNGAAFANVGFKIFLGGDPTTAAPGGVDNTLIIDPLTYAIVRVDGFADAALIQASRLGINRDTNGFYFGRSNGPDFLDLFVSESDEDAFNFSAPYGPVGGIASTSGQFGNVPTSRGLLTLNTVSVVSFRAALPEPASWTLMIGGLGAVGGLIRRQRARPLLARA